MPDRDDAKLQTQEKVHGHPRYVSRHVVEEYDPKNGRFIKREDKVLYAGDKKQSVNKIPNSVRFWPLNPDRENNESWVRLAVVMRARHPWLINLLSMVPACVVLLSFVLCLSLVARVCEQIGINVALIVSLLSPNIKAPWLYAKFESKIFDRLWNVAVPMT